MNRFKLLSSRAEEAMIEIVYASRYIQQLREETSGRARAVPCSLAADLRAAESREAHPSAAKRALRVVRPVLAGLGAIARGALAMAR
jgi:hypothetical protein